MTSDGLPPENPTPPERPVPPAGKEDPPQSAMADAKAAFEKAGFSTPEGTVAFGSLILLSAWLIWDFLIRGSWISGASVVQLAAVVVLIVYFGKAAWAYAIAPRPVLLKSLGYVIAIVGAFHIVAIIRSVGSLRGVGVILQTLVIVAGYVVTYLGARAIRAD